MFYKIMAKVMSVFPAKWNNKDTQGAVGGVIGVSLIIAGALAFGPWLWPKVRHLVLGLLATVLGGCAFNASVEYEHHSSVPMTNDLNTTDQVGVCGEWALGRPKYSPWMEVCLHKELDTANPVFGDDPVGTIRIKQPIFQRDHR